MVGDLRWVQSIAISLILLSTYKYSTSFVRDIKYPIYIGVALNVVFVSLQVKTFLSGNNSYILEWWYRDVPSTSRRPLGFSAFRYGGGVGGPAGLGFFSALSIGYVMFFEQMKTRKYLVLIFATLLLIFSGSRTSFVIVFYFVCIAIVVNPSNMWYYSPHTIIVIMLVVAVNYYVDFLNIFDRYYTIVELLIGKIDYQETAARVSVWEESISRRNNNYYLLGTLSNPSSIYHEIVLDSGYINSYTRLGPIGLLIYMISFVIPTLIALTKKININTLAAVVFVGGFLIMNINAETINTIYGKVIILSCGFFIINRRE
jgi:hypothetical protein